MTARTLPALHDPVEDAYARAELLAAEGRTAQALEALAEAESHEHVRHHNVTNGIAALRAQLGGS